MECGSSAFVGFWQNLFSGTIQRYTGEALKELWELHDTAARKLEELRLLQQRGPGEPTIGPSRLERFISADMEISGIYRLSISRQA